MTKLFSTSSDIYIEINGKKLAAAQSYRAKSSKESRSIEAFGSRDPVGSISGRLRYTIELSRIIPCRSSDANFFELDNFNVVIVKPDKKIIFSGCQWFDLIEQIGVHETMLETVTILATKRIEVNIQQ
ncbi:MAG: hypothetical protein RSB96_04040 [Oscillospiraceae bacterium]